MKKHEADEEELTAFENACKDKDVKEIIAIYKEEIERKDEIIAHLKEENVMLMKASLRASKERLELKEQLEKGHAHR